MTLLVAMRGRRTLVYGAILLVITGATVVTLATRNPLKVDVLRDRGALAREISGGVVENVYRLQLMNTDERPRRYEIRAEGLSGLEVVGVDPSAWLRASLTNALVA